MYTYQIKRDKHVLNHLSEHAVLCVHKYKDSYKTARKICRRRVKAGLVKSELVGEVFLISKV